MKIIHKAIPVEEIEEKFSFLFGNHMDRKIVKSRVRRETAFKDDEYTVVLFKTRDGEEVGRFYKRWTDGGGAAGQDRGWHNSYNMVTHSYTNA
jgi:hypothetical protein